MNNRHARSSNAVIRVENISKSYGNLKAVEDLSFTVRQGEIFGFLGPNGAGKTTTLSILEGLLMPDQGQVTVLGMDIKTHAKEVKRRIRVQLQSTSLLPELTVFEQIQLFASCYRLKPHREEVMAILDQVSLAAKATALPETLSGGQRQRLSLAISLINQPEIIFLDEPTTGLDPQSRRAFWKIIQDLQAEGKTIVLTTHYMEEAEGLCDRVGIIDLGQLVALDTPGALISSLAGLSSITTSSDLPLEELKTLPGIKTADRNRSQLHLQSENMVISLRAVLDLAENHNIPLSELQIKQPNLEDVFLNLTGRMIRG